MKLLTQFFGYNDTNEDADYAIFDASEEKIIQRGAHLTALSFGDSSQHFKTSLPVEIVVRNNYLYILKHMLNNSSLAQELLNRFPLHLACENGNKELVQYLITELHCNPNEKKNHSKLTPLHIASSGGHAEVVNYLIDEFHYDPDECDSSKRSALYHASSHGHYVVVKYLMEKVQSNEYLTDELNNIPLHIAALKGYLNIVRYFIEEVKVDASIEGYEKWTPLHHSSFNGHLNIVKYLIETCNQSAELEDESSNISLHIAAENGHFGTVRYFIEEVHVSPSTEGFEKWTPLHYASQNGHHDIVQYLIEKCNHNPKLRNEDDNMPIHIAAENGHLNILMYFIKEANVESSTEGFKKYTPLHLASQIGHLDMVKYLIKTCGHDPNIRNGNNDTSLQIAADNGHFAIVKYFIEETNVNANIEVVEKWTSLPLASQIKHLYMVQYLFENCKPILELNNEKQTVLLHYAALNGHFDLMKYLLEEVHLNPTSEKFKEWSLLHSASVGGNVEIVKYLIEKCNHKPDLKDGNNDLPLHIAAKNGHFDIVKYFIEVFKGIEATEGFKKSTALHYASERGHFDIVKYLIKNCQHTPEKRNADNNKPIHLAARNGHLNIVKYFIKEVNVDISTEGFQVYPFLHLATMRGDLKFIRYLIEKCTLNSELRNSISDKPLRIAAYCGHFEIVKYFIEEVKVTDIYPEGSNKNTPLHLACENGHTNIVKYLIEMCGQNIELRRNDNNEIPLHIAIKNGYFDIVKYFIEEVNVDASIEGFNNRTPLQYASLYKDLSIVKYLTGRCKHELTNDCNNIPLHMAVHHGYLDLVKYFIEVVKVDARSENFKKWTPLHCASEDGHLNIIKYLIEKCQHNPELRDIDNNIPLHIAALNGHLDVVKYFVEKFNIKVRTEGFNKKIPLHFASRGGNLEVVQYLVEKSNCSPKVRDKNSDMPLHEAASQGHLNIIKYFINKFNVKATTEGCNLWTPLHYASKNGDLSVVQYLINECRHDSELRTFHKNMPVHIAADCGHTNLMNYFVNEVSVDINCKGFKGQTPLHYACEKGHYDIVVILIDTQKCSIISDKDGNTPLHIAARNGDLKILQCLVNNKTLDFHGTNLLNQTPLHLAITNGHLDVVEYIVRDRKVLNHFISRSESISNHDNYGELYFASKSSIIFLAAKQQQIDMLKFICSSCRIDPVMLHNITKIKQVSNEDVLHYIEHYDDPLHRAASKGELEELKYFIEKEWSPLLKDRYGNNALHNAAKNGHVEVVKYLLTLNKFRSEFTSQNREGKLPEELANDNGFINLASYIAVFTSKVINKNYSPYTHAIFVLGNRGSGKSTLVKSLMSEKTLISRFITVRGVTPDTAGVISHYFEDKLIGNVKIYDFAGHEEYYASHEMILKHFQHPLILIVVDISLKLIEIKKQVSYWATIVQNCSITDNTSVLVIASHVNFEKDADNKMAEIGNYIKQNVSTMSYNDGILGCDCRFPGSSQIIAIYNKIVEVCKKIFSKRIKEFSIKENKLCVYFKNYLEVKRSVLPPIISIADMCKILTEDKESNSMHTELCDINNLIKICDILYQVGYLLCFPENDQPSNSFLILNEEEIIYHWHCLLNIVKKEMKFGLIEEKKLEEVLSKSTDILGDTKPCIKYLLYAQFCTLISSASFIEEHLPKGNYYFFPNLVSENKPEFALCQTYTGACTWILSCSEQDQFFTPRCIHVLVMLLAQSEIRGENIKIQVWKNGILLVNGNMVRSVIEFTDQTKKIILFMQSDEDHKLDLVKWRSQLITTIKLQIKSLRPNFHLNEAFLCPPNNFICEGIEIPMCDIISTIKDDRDEGVTCRDKQDKIGAITLKKLLFFDSFESLRHCTCFQKVIKSQGSEIVPSSILKDIKTTIDHIEIKEFLNEIIKKNKILKYSELIRELLQYSVITEDNIKDLSDSPFSEVDSPPVKANGSKSGNWQENSVYHEFNMSNLKLLECSEPTGRLQLITEISPKWKDAAILLGLSDIVERTEMNCGKVEECCQQVMMTWLHQKDREYRYSPNWEGFCKLLVDLQLSTLSEQVIRIVFNTD